jgi:hypothetical protein
MLLLNFVRYLHRLIQPLLAACIYIIVTIRSLILSGSAQWGTQHDLLPALRFQHTEWWRIDKRNDPTTDVF